MRAIHTIVTLEASYGGPVRSVTALAEALSALSVDVDVIARRAADQSAELIVPAGERVRTHFARPTVLGQYHSGAGSFAQSIRDCARDTNACVVHDHGIWLSTNHTTAAVSREQRLARIVSPRGMLSEWALRFRGWKKKPAWYLYQRRDLRSAQALHATSEEEVEDIRRVGLTQPVVLVRNGVRFPSATSVSAPRSANTKQALFLSRIHKKKGVLNLIAAWGRVRPRGWRLVIAGPDDGGHRAEVEALIAREALGDGIELAGPIGDEAKWALYKNSDLFVLPTFSENFGIVVAEALATGVPVITTTGAPWRDLVTNECGWWIDPTVDALEGALREATTLPPDQLGVMGSRGRSYAHREFSWSNSAAALRDTYHWLIHGGSPPACVVDG